MCSLIAPFRCVSKWGESSADSFRQQQKRKTKLILRFKRDFCAIEGEGRVARRPVLGFVYLRYDFSKNAENLKYLIASWNVALADLRRAVIGRKLTLRDDRVFRMRSPDRGGWNRLNPSLLQSTTNLPA